MVESSNKRSRHSERAWVAIFGSQASNGRGAISCCRTHAFRAATIPQICISFQYTNCLGFHSRPARMSAESESRRGNICHPRIHLTSRTVGTPWHTVSGTLPLSDGDALAGEFKCRHCGPSYVSSVSLPILDFPEKSGRASANRDTRVGHQLPPKPIGWGVCNKKLCVWKQWHGLVLCPLVNAWSIGQLIISSWRPAWCLWAWSVLAQQFVAAHQNVCWISIMIYYIRA